MQQVKLWCDSKHNSNVTTHTGRVNYETKRSTLARCNDGTRDAPDAAKCQCYGYRAWSEASCYAHARQEAGGTSKQKFPRSMHVEKQEERRNMATSNANPHATAMARRWKQNAQQCTCMRRNDSECKSPRFGAQFERAKMPVHSHEAMTFTRLQQATIM